MENNPNPNPEEKEFTENQAENQQTQDGGQTEGSTFRYEEPRQADAGTQSNNWSAQSGSYTERQTNNGWNQTYGQNPGWYTDRPLQSDGRAATAALILGIIAVAGVCCCAVPGIIFGIAGFICSIVAGKKEGRLQGRALAGMILSIIGFAMGIAGVLLGAVYLYVVQNKAGQMVMSPDDFEDFMEQFQNGNWMPR